MGSVDMVLSQTTQGEDAVMPDAVFSIEIWQGESLPGSYDTPSPLDDPHEIFPFPSVTGTS